MPCVRLNALWHRNTKPNDKSNKHGNDRRNGLKWHTFTFLLSLNYGKNKTLPISLSGKISL
ncbi:hypothetical protein [Moraxella lacunata]|uniref:hypothetical protein n=1 Tax=Moraxella lacunata TaxID=477 RepID=UPI003EDE7C74